MRRAASLLLTLAIVLFIPVKVNATAISTTTIGATTLFQKLINQPLRTTAFEATTNYRGVMSPLTGAVTLVGGLVIMAVGDGINNLRVQMASPLPPAPDGWVDAESPPAVSNGTSVYYYSASATSGGSALGYNYLTPAAACASQGWGWDAEYHLPTGPYGYCTSLNYREVKRTSVTGCNQGYTLSNGICNLSNAAIVQWPADGIGSLKRSGSAWILDPRDPDNSAYSGTFPNFTRTGLDTHSNPVKETLTPNTSGGTDYKRDTETLNPSTGEPMVQRDQITTNGQGDITNITTTTFGNSTITNVNTSNVITAPTAPVDTSTLAKETTLNDIKTKLNETPPAMESVETVRTIAASNTAVLNKLKSKLPSATFSDTVPECPVFSQYIPFFNTTLTIDQFCTMDNLIRPVINIISIVMWSVMGFFIVVGA